jgi:hypothetical protein
LNEELEMAGRPEGSGLHHHRFDLRYLDGFATAILLSARRKVMRTLLNIEGGP